MASIEQSTKSSSWLGGFVSLLKSKGTDLGSGATSEVTQGSKGVEETVGKVELALDELKRLTAAKRSDLELRAGGKTRSTVSSKRKVSAEQEEQRKQQLVLNQQKMFADIIALHEKLQTGINKQSLTELRDFIIEQTNLVADWRNQTLDQQIKAAVLTRVYQETGRIAWDRLANLMEKNGVDFGAPAGIAPGTSGEEIERAKERLINEEEDFFIAMPAPQIAQVAVGVVPAWRNSYPDQGSSVWQRIALRGVGCGIRAQLAKAAIQYLNEYRDQIRDEAHKLLEKELAMVEECLNQGVNSVEQADKVVAGTSTMFQEVIPELCWQRVSSLLKLC